jgi:hypothetical protein
LFFFFSLPLSLFFIKAASLSPGISALSSEEEPDDSAWANFPRVYRGEDREYEGALFHVTTRMLRSASGLRKVIPALPLLRCLHLFHLFPLPLFIKRSLEFYATVEMLINKTVACFYYYIICLFVASILVLWHFL